MAIYTRKVMCGNCKTELSLPCKTVSEMKKELRRWNWEETSEYGWVCSKCKNKLKKQ